MEILLQVHWNTDRDTWWHEEMAKVGSECEPEWMKSEDPLFLLYTRSVGAHGVDLWE